MARKKIIDNTEQIVEAVIQGIQEKKGTSTVVLNMKEIHNSLWDYFIICDASSSTQAEAIADSVREFVKKQTTENVYQKEGFENAQWILLDYVSVVVHIFQRQYREFYNLENLWADAKTTLIKDPNIK